MVSTVFGERSATLINNFDVTLTVQWTMDGISIYIVARQGSGFSSKKPSPVGAQMSACAKKI